MTTLLRNTKQISSLGRVIIASLALISISASGQEDVSFKYSGDNGPSHWAELNSDWETCSGASSDAIQSPINIRKIVSDRTLEKLDLRTFPTTVDIFNNGHTIEQRYEGTGSTIFWDGIDYELNQFHFHTLSEHTVLARHVPLELHAVFTSADGRFLVISQLFSIGRGENSFIRALIDAGLPQKNGDESASDSMIDVGNALRDTRSYYTYTGSLTTPPCTEGVTWIVLKKRSSLTHPQYQEFRQILGNNFRPLQVRNNRTIRSTARNGNSRISKY